MSLEIENISYNQIKNISLNLVDIKYRPIHLHLEIEVLLVLEGEPIFIINGESFLFKKDDIILINSNQLHEIICKDGICTFLSLHILPQYFEGYYPELSHIRFLSNYIISENKELFKYTFLKLLKTYTEKEIYYEIQCASLVNIMFYDILKNSSYKKMPEYYNKDINRQMERISKIIHYLQKHYSEKITLQQISEHLNLSPSFLSHFIKESTNYSFRELLTYIRYVNAKCLIIKNKLSLIDICYNCGFSDYKYMKNAFIKYSNCSPNDFRKKAKKISTDIFYDKSYKVYSNFEVEQFIKKIYINIVL